MNKESLEKFKGYLEYELKRKVYSDDYKEVLQYFSQQVEDELKFVDEESDDVL